MKKPETVAISAPGKVLLAGGYLVVDRAYQGLVFGLSARIHVIVQDRNDAPGAAITVQSPQFHGAAWDYHCTNNPGLGTSVSQSKSTVPRNKFVETALSYALSYLSHQGIKEAPSLKITILADSDYYSHYKTSKPCPANSESRFKDFGVKLENAHKTGLGSSAALVTAFVSAVVLHSLGITKVDDNRRRSLHNLAQIAHCVAQGKIGSGFDVAAAVYGSCIYQRFSPSVLDQIGSIGSTQFEERLVEAVDDIERRIWDTRIDASAVDLPKGLRLVMCDVDCGSETPSMVKKVMNWRKERPEESLLLWETLSRANLELAAELRNLSDGSSNNWTSLINDIQVIRSLIREMSVKADVPIEPPIQTHLLDGCSAIKGILGGVVPGAGGYDALSIIIEDSEEVMNKLENYLSAYESPPDLEQGTKIGNVRLLDVKQEAEGLKIEASAQYTGWV